MVGVFNDRPVGEVTLDDHRRGRLPEFMRPDETFVVDEIPTTETNEMRTFELREDLLQ